MLSVLFTALFAVVFGLAFCFFGYRVFLVLLPIWGFFGGFWLGAQMMALLFGTGFLVTITGWVAGFILGMVFAILSYLFYILGVALVAASFGAAIGAGFMAALGFEGGFFVIIVALLCAVFVAVLTLVMNLQKYVIILITAFGGANAIILSALLILGRVSMGNIQSAGNAIRPVLSDSFFWLILWLALAGAGVVIQIISNRTYTFSKEQFQEGWS
ncbi:MAG TPA: DUF4203 domain-containing protein [Anaerolineae bacterium]|nr:DUF4203 domain-containing protein [Anaerolineales bacterium]HRV95641.1 DUF4203 domain-containing protein [Anaerolineae bacterium]